MTIVSFSDCEVCVPKIYYSYKSKLSTKFLAIMSETDIDDDQVNVSHLYAIVNMDNKSKKNIMETRVSNKFEYSIPDISESLPELSNSDSNLYATLLSVEEIQDSLSCSRTFFGSADDIAIGDTDRTEVSVSSHSRFIR